MRIIDADSFREWWLENGENERIYDTNDVLDSIDNWPTLTPPNEPLTIDQLREMDGEPVYITPMKWWALVDAPKGLRRVVLRLKSGGWAALYSDEDLKYYAKAIYRRPPEGEA